MGPAGPRPKPEAQTPAAGEDAGAGLKQGEAEELILR